MRDAHDLTPSDRFQYTPTLSCVMPAYNEGKNLGTLVPKVLSALQALGSQVEIVLVNDGSRDDTAQVIQALCALHREVVGINLSRNFGKEAALTAGIDAARGEVVVLMDSDGQHPVSLVTEMVQRWREGSDVVYAIRRTRDDQSALHAGLTGMFYKLINAGNRVKIPAHAGDFRLMDRQVVNALLSLPERNRFMKGIYAWVGYKSIGIPYFPLERTHGESTFSKLKLAQLAWTGVTSFSVMPLRLASAVGAGLAFLSFIYGVWVVIDKMFFSESIPGWPTVVASMMFLAGVQLLFIGILGEYLARIYDEVKGRPPYIVAEVAKPTITKAKTSRSKSVNPSENDLWANDTQS